MRTAILFAAAIGLAVPTTSALAQKQVTVEYADLDLDSKEGQDKLDRRIRVAAESFCDADRIVTGSNVKSREAKRCVAETTTIIKKSLAAILDDKKMGG